MDELISYGGAGQGCVICPDAMQPPFESDVEAVAHMAQHTPEDLAFALLTENATVHRFLEAIDQPGGIRTERHAEELLGDVEDTADRSPAKPRPPQPGERPPRSLARVEYGPGHTVRLYGQGTDGQPSELELSRGGVLDLMSALVNAADRWRGTDGDPDAWVFPPT
ncbi:hypothetical protein [Streptomyces chrestomyceticus]|uniref:hypothetical protein n=1 Tax=Streptomyces chrestomyceticus TaxID=68185 RepID=UPI0033D7EFE5